MSRSSCENLCSRSGLCDQELCELAEMADCVFVNSTGLFDEWLQHTRDAVISHIRQNARLFESLEDYTDAFSSSVSSKMYFENLQSLLSIFFGAQLLILFVFILPKRWSLLLRRIASLPGKLRIYLAVCIAGLDDSLRRIRNQTFTALIPEALHQAQLTR